MRYQFSMSSPPAIGDVTPNSGKFTQLQATSNKQILSGDKVIASKDPQYQFLDPNGASRNVTLPLAVVDMFFIIKNIGTSGYVLTVKDSSNITITGGAIANGIAIGFYYDGSAWQIF